MSKNFLISIVYILFITVETVKSTNENQKMSMELINSQFEVIKYAIKATTMRIELLTDKLEEFLKPMPESDNFINKICDNDTQASLKVFVNHIQSIKLNQNKIENTLVDLESILKKELNVEAAPQIESNESKDVSEILNEVLNKQITLETVFQLILENREKMDFESFMKAQFDDLKNFIKFEKNTKVELPLHDKNLNCLRNCDDELKIFDSCKSALYSNAFKAGAYLIQIKNSNLEPFYVFCEHNEFDWMIIQRREDGSQNFYRNWSGYKHGFGVVFGEYWIGLDRLHAITENIPHRLLIMIKDSDKNEIYAEYFPFYVGNEEEGYKLTIKFDKGNATDAFTYHNGMKFSTYDKDNDESDVNCAKEYRSAWWHRNCYQSNLNGEYFPNNDAEDVSSLHLFFSNNTTVKEGSYVHMAIRPSESN